MAPLEPHSARDLNARRAHLWNLDFLVLMAHRWGLSGARDVLDVGCGLGHWSLALASLLPGSARVTGVDREPRWVEAASAIVAGTPLRDRLRFQVADAHALPWADASFDVVTCQTLLIHVPDPLRVLLEMKRVLRPGGLLVAIEPNNLVQSLVPTSATAGDSVDAQLRRVRFQLLCERGRARLGEGNVSVGDLVPGMFRRLGLRSIAVHLSDKASMLVPPYETEEQRTDVALAFDGPVADDWIWPRDDARRYFVAGGGPEAEFDEGWDAVAADLPRRQREAYLRGELERAGGRLLYLVSGRA